MDELLARITDEADTEFRSAVQQWMRLKHLPADSSTLKDFSLWLGERAAHRQAFARVETLWQTVQVSLRQLDVSEARPSRQGRSEHGPFTPTRYTHKDRGR